MDNNQIFAGILLAMGIILFYRNWKASRAAVEHIEAGTRFLAENGQRDGVITTKSGLQYEIVEEGTGEVHPSSASKVTVHYHGTLIDGSVFDSSVERGDAIIFKVRQVIKGWQEGLQLMVAGQKIRLYVPHNLAYGKRGVGKVPPGSVLIFDVLLINVQ
ncbi:FKBP-type peptidyl-prolyl cis-trans isomerase [Vibrio sp. RC27]